MTGQRLTDLLALSHVPRWSIVDHSKPQTVSDHVYRTLVIATELAQRLHVPISGKALIYILSHDADECRTGDIPTPAKKSLNDWTVVGWEVCPWTREEPSVIGLTQEEIQIILLADTIEATTFIQRYGIGAHAGRVFMSLCRSVNDKCPAEWLHAVRQLMQEINEDAGR